MLGKVWRSWLVAGLKYQQALLPPDKRCHHFEHSKAAQPAFFPDCHTFGLRACLHLRQRPNLVGFKEMPLETVLRKRNLRSEAAATFSISSSSSRSWSWYRCHSASEKDQAPDGASESSPSECLNLKHRIWSALVGVLERVLRP